MAEMKKHVGKVKNTDKKCVVVFMQIPDNPEYALVVDTDALPERYHEELMTIVEGEGQRHQNLYDILSRRMSTHTNQTILESLHNAKYLQPVHIDNIQMHPLPNQAIDLRKVLEMIQNEQPQDHGQQVVQEQPNYDTSQNAQSYNRILENQNASKDEEKVGVAKNLITEAEMLEQEAQQKRNQAYEMAPSLKPAQKSSSNKGKSKAKSKQNSNTETQEQANSG